MEVSFEEDVFRDVWFPATIVEYLGNDLFIVEYRFANNEDEIRRVTVDQVRIRPLVPEFRVSNFSLLEKVDAFCDFGWWSGVITKKLAGSKYIVYFKHTNRVKEFSHLELRPHVEWRDDKWFTPYQVPVSDNDAANGESDTVNCSADVIEKDTLNFTNAIEDTTPVIIKQASIVTTSMKRSKPTSNKKLSPKKLKGGVTSDEPSLSNVEQNKEVNVPTVDESEHVEEETAAGQTVDKSKNLSRGKKKTGKRGKRVGVKRAVFKKKGKVSASSTSVPKAVPQDLTGATSDSTTVTTTTEVVDEQNAVKFYTTPIVLAMHCPTMTITQNKKLKEVTDHENSPKYSEAQTPKLVVPMSPKATVNMEEKEADVDTVPKRKRGRPFKIQPKSPETSLAVYHANGDAVAETSASQKMKKTSSLLTKVPNKSSGIELTLQQENNSKPVKGKRGKRRAISSINIQSPTRADTMPDDQPLSSWFHGKLASAALDSTSKKSVENSKLPIIAANGDSQKLNFEKRSQLWETLESMDVFRLFPQKPHFEPLNTLKESARERQAIGLMVNFSGVYEDIARLRFDNISQTEFEDHLETLSELETHGFDVNPIRNRLTRFLSATNKQEKFKTRRKGVEENLEVGRVEKQRFDQDIELIDKEVNTLLERRGQTLKKKEKKEAQMVGWEAELEEIDEGMLDVRREFEELVAAPW